MDTGIRETIEGKSNRVMVVAGELAKNINNFLAPSPNKTEGDSPTPSIDALCQIAENLTQTEIALIEATALFEKLKALLR